MVDDATARAWLAEVGFAEGDLRSEITINEKMKCPMAWACQSGELGLRIKQKNSEGNAM